MACPFLEQNTHLRVLTGFSGAGRRLVALAISVSLSYVLMEFGSEGRCVVAAGEGTGRRSAAPRVVLGLGTAAGGRTAAGASPTAEAAASAAAAAGLVHLGGGIPQRGADLVDLDLDNGALLSLPGFEGPLLEPSGDDHARAAGEAFGHILGGLTPDVAPQEQGLAVLPFPALPVIDAGRRRH